MSETPRHADEASLSAGHRNRHARPRPSREVDGGDPRAQARAREELIDLDVRRLDDGVPFFRCPPSKICEVHPASRPCAAVGPRVRSWSVSAGSMRPFIKSWYFFSYFCFVYLVFVVWLFSCCFVFTTLSLSSLLLFIGISDLLVLFLCVSPWLCVICVLLFLYFFCVLSSPVVSSFSRVCCFRQYFFLCRILFGPTSSSSYSYIYIVFFFFFCVMCGRK